ncbi:uncharacterized protein EAE97_003095 [Botrytis byssoidea]|uniref:Uncharacterized protein n=1 Tax=Botrytis byssoidea TaxID=139641 RepID=A0A9P5IWV1_9HELO|nr:uncharacterized protein EAE97_003095 [Botrytis byssoidea]KAF7949586.1 hypothetical protein EAE97_003095 [Botrytis byssoidea]
MSSNGNSNNGGTTPPNESSRPRRGSITAQTFTNIFRSNSTSAGGPVGPFPGPISTGASQDHKRRMSISTLGLSGAGASPTQSSAFPFGGRRGSVSTTASESIDESAIDDEDGPSRGTPTTPFARRMSFGAQALRTVRTGNGSPGTNGRTPSYTTSTLSPIPAGSQGGGRVTPPGTQSLQASTQSKPRTPSDFASSARPGEGGFNWSEQLRSRAESQVSQSQRPIMSTSPPNSQRFNVPMHERAKSIGDAPAPPTSVIPPVAASKPARKQPDAFQERILKGDFYMD